MLNHAFIAVCSGELLWPMDLWVFSSPELKAHKWAYSIGRHPSSVRQHFQTTSPLKPRSRFLPNFTYSINRPGERIIVWAYSIPVIRRPSVVHTFKFEYLWSQLANLDQILCVASLGGGGGGEGCIRSWGRLDQNSGFHGNRKPPLTYNGENDVSTFSRLFLIRSFLYLQVKRTCIKSRTS